MGKLSLTLKKKVTPYEESSCKFELWGEFTLKHDGKLLTKAQWDLTDFIKWFMETKEILESEVFPFAFTNSIAESRDLLFEKIDRFSDSQEQEMFDYVDYLSDYFTNHYFHLKGTNTQEYYIGLVPNGCGEISYFADNTYHAYLYDMNHFIKTTENEIEHFLKSMDIQEESRAFFKETLPDYYPFLVN